MRHELNKEDGKALPKVIVTDGRMEGQVDDIDATFVLNDRLENSQVYRNAANEKNWNNK